MNSTTSRALVASLVPLLAGVLSAGCSSGSKAVDQAAVEERTTEGLEQETGQRPDDVECPGDLKAEVGETMRCVLSAGGDRIGITLEVTEVDGDNAFWDFAVDDEMLEPGEDP